MKKVTKEDLKGEIADFPIEVVQWMCEQQVKQGHKFDPSVFAECKEMSGFCKGIHWDETELGYSVCGDIIMNKNFHIFFDHFKPKKRTFESGSVRDDDSEKPLVNHLDAYVRLRFGTLLRQGANEYGKNNWRKGQPTEAAVESLNRHLAKYELGDKEEDHLSAIIFNVQLIMKNEEKEGIKYNHYQGCLK